jgi:HPt (histidine-containing phosphotransfer) domain-containing protein
MRHKINKSTQPIDRGILDEIRAFHGNGNPDLTGRLIAAYIENSPKFIKELHEAATLCDYDALQMTAYIFKSSSLSLGAMVLASLCDRLGHQDHIADDGDTPELIARIEEEHMEVVAALELEIRNTAP